MRIPILTYHSVAETNSIITISPKMFKRQMSFLRNNGYKSLTLTELINVLQKKEALLEKTFVITFDDGYQDIYTEAFPIMEEFGFKGTVFLITDYIIKERRQLGNSSADDRESYLSWIEIKEMNKYGIEFGAHTVTHPDLTNIPFYQADREIRDSKIEIENKLGVEVSCFAYPYGKYNASIKKTIQNYFTVACTTKLGKVRSYHDPFELKRIDTYYLSNYRFFTRLPTHTMDLYLYIRQIFREFKEIFI